MAPNLALLPAYKAITTNHLGTMYAAHIYFNANMYQLEVSPVCEQACMQYLEVFSSKVSEEL